MAITVAEIAETLRSLVEPRSLWRYQLRLITSFFSF